jgi:glyoxylase-like metal-dependent hydrolase (beta-lactamase superfamily II)
MSNKSATIPLPSPRIIHSGEHLDHVHLIDLNLYDSSLFANACVLDAGTDRVLFDTGTSATTGQIVTYIKYHGLDDGKYFIVPSHHHFDHAGGIASLVRHFKKNGIPATVVTTPKMADCLADLPDHVEGARRQFQQMIGTIEAVSREDMLVLAEGVKFTLSDGSSIELLPTPGHSPDHVSPVVRDGDRTRLVFFGEALGINLRHNLSPIPSSTAPSYDSKAYKASIAKIKATGADAGIFSHVGGITGAENFTALCDLALEKVDEVTEFITRLHQGGIASTAEMVTKLKGTYRDYIATCVMDDKVVSNLAFLLVYGVLRDLGLK